MADNTTDTNSNAIDQARADGWKSFVTALGTRSRDKRQSYWFTPDLSSRAEQEALWRGNVMAAKAVEKLPKEGMRKGFDIKISSLTAAKPTDLKTDDFPPGQPGATPFAPPAPKQPKPIKKEDNKAQEITRKLMNRWVELDGYTNFKKAWEYQRAFGGAVILLGLNDGNTDMSKELDESAIQSLDWINTFTCTEMIAERYYADPRQPKYGKVAVYRIQPAVVSGPQAISGNWTGTQSEQLNKSGFGGGFGGNYALNNFLIHESRLITWQGIFVSQVQTRQQNGWGDSIFNRVGPVLRDYGVSWDAAATLLQDFSQAVYKMKGLLELVASGNTDELKKRLDLLDMSRSVVRAILLDAEGEDFERKVTPLTGLPELLEKFMLALASAFDMPVSLLMGQAPAGLNATGDSDIHNWYDDVSSVVEHDLTPKLTQFFRLMMLAKNGPTNGVVPDQWCIEHKPLWQLDDLQTATLRKTQADTDHIYITDGVVTPEEIAASRFGGEKYSTETQIDFDGREEMAKEAESNPPEPIPTNPVPEKPVPPEPPKK
jgi:phage-related protein (TIGR01555 family)